MQPPLCTMLIIVQLKEFCLRNALIIQTAAVYSLYLQAMHSFLLSGIFTYIIATLRFAPLN